MHGRDDSRALDRRHPYPLGCLRVVWDGLMAFHWVDKPLAPPHVCAFTRSGEPDVGPFLETGLPYLTPVQDASGDLRIVPTINTLYLSAQAIREMCAEPGSPIVCLTLSDHYEFVQASSERDELATRVEELEAELATLRAGQSSVDVEALASALVIPLKSHFAAKSGPKPRTAA